MNPPLVEEPAAFDTRIGPLDAPAGTRTEIVFEVRTDTSVASTLKGDELLKNVTLVPAPKFDPVIVMKSPTCALVGLNPVIVGALNATTSV